MEVSVIFEGLSYIYNSMKSSETRTQISHWYDEWKFYRPIFLTGVFNDYLGYGYGEYNLQRIVKNNKHFTNDLHRRVYKKSKKKIVRLVVIENRWGKGRYHTHMILETPEHLSSDQYKVLLRQSWLKTRNGVDTKILTHQEIYDEVGLKDYLSKEVSPKSVTGVDVENSYISYV